MGPGDHAGINQSPRWFERGGPAQRVADAPRTSLTDADPIDLGRDSAPPVSAKRRPSADTVCVPANPALDRPSYSVAAIPLEASSPRGARFAERVPAYPLEAVNHRLTFSGGFENLHRNVRAGACVVQ